jgi:hypothetical protein
MKRYVFTLLLISIFGLVSSVFAQQRRVSKSVKSLSATAKKVVKNKAFIVDQRLAIVRLTASLYAKPLQRMSAGREIAVGESKEADGVTFYRVFDSKKATGWIQADAITGTFRRGDDERLARLIQGSEGFERIERASIFIDLFPTSPLRPPILLLFGDLIEEEAARLSVRATRNLDRREMAASGAPLHSFYLNYPFLDRFRRLGVVFLFNSNTRNYHYDGETWKQLLKKYATSSEVVEAQKRLDSLREKLERQK